MNEFIHLHLHSEYSILDGQTLIGDIPKIAERLGQHAVAVTDHGSLASSLRLFKSAKEHNIKPIFGVETYVSPSLDNPTKDTSIWHLVLLSTNRRGLQNLFEMSSLAWTKGFYKRPRVDYSTLDAHSEGVIALSACMAGEMARSINADNLDEAVEAAKRYRSIFGDRFYIELQPGNTKELNSSLNMIADDLNIKTVVTVDSHYDIPEHKTLQEVLLIAQQFPSFKKPELDYARLVSAGVKNDTLMYKLNKMWPKRYLRYDELKLHIMDRYEVLAEMNKQGFYGNDLCDTTLEIAERCEQIEFKTGVSYLPKYNPKIDSDILLREYVEHQLNELGFANDQVYVDRINEELALIKDKNFADYFLLVYDLINTARQRNIYVGPGRGSAAGSLVAYCLNITAIDPIKYKLLFFRFLDPERNDFPDIDMDFEHTRREEMKEYLRTKYGYVLGISTYTGYHAKSVVKAVARVLAIDLAEVEKATTQFNDFDEFESSDNPKIVAFKAAHPELLGPAKELDEHIQSSGAHAAGIVVSNIAPHLIVPVETRVDPDDKTKRIQVSAFDMNDTAEVGLIKLDLLGLKNLTVIHDCVDSIKERHDIDIDWEHLEPDDSYVLSELSKGSCTGVFQMESGVFRKLLQQIGVDSFNDLVAANALVRPGAYDLAKDYADIKHGFKEASYVHPLIEQYLEDTFAQTIYQEQIMQMCYELGGMSWGLINGLRKAIGKKLTKAEFAPYHDPWIEGASRHITNQQAEQIWQQWLKSSRYLFNLSHSVCYAYIGYVCAYLKLYYPIEYIYAMLKHERNATTTMSYLLEAQRLGINILGPDINRSQQAMSIDEDSLRFGLADIKKVGFAACEEIISKRPFNDWDDFQTRITARKCNSAVVASLVAVDAFRSLANAPHNDSAHENYQEYLNYPIALHQIAELGIDATPIAEIESYSIVAGVTKNIKRTNTYVRIDLEDTTASLTCFGSMTNDLKDNEVIIALVGDNTMLGYARVDGLKERLANNKLDNFERFLFKNDFWEPYELLYGHGFGGIYDEKSLVVPISVKSVKTKKGSMMGFCYVIDNQLNIEKLTVFPGPWATIEPLLQEWQPVAIKIATLKDGGKSLWADGIKSADELLKIKQELI